MGKISRKQLANMINKMADEGQSPKKIAARTAAYLIDEKRTKELDSLLRDTALLRAQAGRVEAQAVSARKLSEPTKSELKKLLSDTFDNAQHVMLHEEIDPSVTGGVKIDAPGLRADLTVHGRLNRLIKES